ncbi:uncharacterized protein LOC111044959 [Nilaparvata lugens]|uniref:uncharacterized protein LOC111044959 n=1 Tax=Nilaparvata lugens TaxID=108931 RepID=UPI00193DEF18|nr:uncharacterized protein LOC111044959 [Nilaparvata lugens]
MKILIPVFTLIVCITLRLVLVEGGKNEENEDLAAESLFNKIADGKDHITEQDLINYQSRRDRMRLDGNLERELRRVLSSCPSQPVDLNEFKSIMNSMRRE